MAESLEVKIEAGIAQMLFNRPEVYNAMNPEIIEGLARHCTALQVQCAIRWWFGIAFGMANGSLS